MFFQMNNNEDIYQIDNHKYIVTTKIIENAKSLDKLCEAFSKYVLRKLNTNKV